MNETWELQIEPQITEPVDRELGIVAWNMRQIVTEWLKNTLLVNTLTLHRTDGLVFSIKGDPQKLKFLQEALQSQEVQDQLRDKLFELFMQYPIDLNKASELMRHDVARLVPPGN
jgi:hypothetical protein